MNPINIETQRLLLRPFEERDRQAVLEFNSHPDVVKYTGEEALRTLEEAEKVIETIWKRDYEIQGYGRLAVVYKPDNKVIGFSGLKWEADIEQTDIGYRFLPQYWGKGIATESCLPLLDYGFEKLGLHQIVGLAYPANIASCKVLEKIGMHQYKTDYFPGDDKKCLWHKIKNKKATPIVVSQDIECSKEKVWTAITVVDKMRKWYFEQLERFEAKLGFSTHFLILNANKRFTHRLKVTYVKTYDSISYLWRYDEYEGVSKSNFKIVETAKGVNVTITCTGLETFPQNVDEFKPQSCQAGWEYFINRLKNYCEE